MYKRQGELPRAMPVLNCGNASEAQAVLVFYHGVSGLTPNQAVLVSSTGPHKFRANVRRGPKEDLARQSRVDRKPER
jgi:hypothetical protein